MAQRFAKFHPVKRRSPYEHASQCCGARLDLPAPPGPHGAWLLLRLMRDRHVAIFRARLRDCKPCALRTACLGPRFPGYCKEIAVTTLPPGTTFQHAKAVTASTSPVLHLACPTDRRLDRRQVARGRALPGAAVAAPLCCCLSLCQQYRYAKLGGPRHSANCAPATQTPTPPR